LGVRSTLCRNSGNVIQSHGMPARIDASGIASTRVIVSIARSRSSGRTGAKPNPQLPITTDVMPCQLDSVQYGSQNTWAS
jgi:hypothetical protein